MLCIRGRVSHAVSSLRSDHGALIHFVDAIPWPLYHDSVSQNHARMLCIRGRVSHAVSSLRSDHGALIHFVDAIPWPLYHDSVSQNHARMLCIRGRVSHAVSSLRSDSDLLCESKPNRMYVEQYNCHLIAQVRSSAYFLCRRYL